MLKQKRKNDKKKGREIIIRKRRKLKVIGDELMNDKNSIKSTYLAMEFSELAMSMSGVREKQTLKQFNAGKIEKLLFPRNLAADPQQ